MPPAYSVPRSFSKRTPCSVLRGGLPVPRSERRGGSCANDSGAGGGDRGVQPGAPLQDAPSHRHFSTCFACWCCVIRDVPEQPPGGRLGSTASSHCPPPPPPPPPPPAFFFAPNLAGAEPQQNCGRNAGEWWQNGRTVVEWCKKCGRTVVEWCQKMRELERTVVELWQKRGRENCGRTVAAMWEKYGGRGLGVDRHADSQRITVARRLALVRACVAPMLTC